MKKFLLPFMLLSIIIATPILTHAQSPDWETSQDGMFEVFEYNRDTDTYYTHTKPRVGHLYLIDQENNGNPEYNTGFKVGSKIYGYIYNPYRHRPEQLSVQFEYKVPKGVCMKADGLPALLDDLVLDSQDPYNKPKLITPEYIQAQYNNTMNIIESKPINLKDASVSFNSNIPWDFDWNTGMDVYEIKFDKILPDGYNLGSYNITEDLHFWILWKTESPFSYMSNTKTSWTEYKNREDVTLEDEECITDFRIDEGYSMSAGIYTFNFIVTDKNISSIDTELIFTWGVALKHQDKTKDIIFEFTRPSKISLLKEKVSTFAGEQCVELPIDITVEKAEEKPTPSTPPTPTPPTTPTTTSNSGPGGYVETKPTKVEETIVPKVENITPILSLQCQNIVKNLDDARLLEYYKKLQVETGLNVNGDISRLDLVRLMVNAGYLNVDASEDISVLNDFADVAKNSWYAPYVAKLIKKDIISLGELSNDEKNNSLKLFDIYGNIAREDAVKILSSIIAEKNLRLPTLDEILTFSDVKNTDKNADYIQYAYNACLVHGRKTLDGNPINGNTRVFEGKSNITLAEVSKILFNGQDLRK